MNVVVGATSDVGQVRQVNEDSYFVDEPLFGIADGMGGHVAGDIASTTAVETIERNSEDAVSSGEPEMLARLIQRANSAIWEKAQAEAGLAGMGTTCTLLLLDDNRAHLAHVGDSRAYLFRSGQLKQVTEDHTLVARMVREGRLAPEEAHQHPQRSVITRTLGVDPDIDVDLRSLDVFDGDRLLLCSDGLSGMVDDATIAQVLQEESDPQRAADELVALANKAGGEDNITVVVVDVTDDAGAATTGARPARRSTGPREHTPVEGSRSQQTRSAEPAPSRSWRRTLVVTFVVVVLLALAAFGAGQYVLANSWFVGVSDDGSVAIFSGLPEEIGGLDLRKEQRVSEIALEDLPEFLRDDVADGIKVGSFDEAQERVDNLEERARDFGQQPTGTRKRKG